MGGSREALVIVFESGSRFHLILLTVASLCCRYVVSVLQLALLAFGFLNRSRPGGYCEVATGIRFSLSSNSSNCSSFVCGLHQGSFVACNTEPGGFGATLGSVFGSGFNFYQIFRILKKLLTTFFFSNVSRNLLMKIMPNQLFRKT